jgi:hypothetical protein
MALNAAPEHLALLAASYERSSTFDSHWWALTGMADYAPHLIRLVGQPELSERAHDAWLFLTGVDLPRRPAVMSVDEEKNRVDEDVVLDSRIKMVPDVNYADTWLEAHRDAWGTQRWVMGQLATPEWLNILFHMYAGVCVNDLADMLALKQQRPLDINARWCWQSLRISAHDRPHSQKKNAIP